MRLTTRILLFLWLSLPLILWVPTQALMFGDVFAKRRPQRHNSTNHRYRLLVASKKDRTPNKTLQTAATSTNHDDDRSLADDDPKDDHNERFRRRGMALALSACYFAVMGAKCALPSVFSLLTLPDQGLTFAPRSSTFAAAATSTATLTMTAQAQMSQLLRASTLAVALGKLVLGPSIDALGGIRTLQIALTSLVSLLLVVTLTQHFYVFAACWVVVDFIFSACWAACINAIYQSFPESEWGRQIGILATGARIGNTVAFSLFGAVLYRFGDVIKQPWRVVFFMSAVLQVLPLGLLAYFGRLTLHDNNTTSQTIKTTRTTMATRAIHQPKGKSVTKTHSSIRDSLLILRREAQAPEFWLHLISRACLMIFASFLLFVPTLMNNVYGCSLAFSNVVGSVYSIGCLLSISLGSQVYSSLSKRQQIILNAGLLLVAMATSLVQLLSVSGRLAISTTTSVFTMFLWGFAFSIPFYLPPSLYALEKGGKQSSASIADAFDFLGFALLASFNGYVGSINQSQALAWSGPFQVTTACSLISLVSLSFAVYLQQ